MQMMAIRGWEGCSFDVALARSRPNEEADHVT